MKVVFLSNYYNHHQSEFSEVMNEITSGKYIFIETIPMEAERNKLGWGMNECPSYVKKIYLDDAVRKECEQLIVEADAVIIGSAPYSLLKERIKRKKLIFRYSERIYKRRSSLFQWPLRFIKYHFQNRFNKNIYLLCASAYASADYAKTCNFIGKSYKWGYFPQTKYYQNINECISKKDKNSILWVARLVKWKHPELAIEIAEKLKKQGYTFTMRIIGNGDLETKLLKLIKEKDLGEYVELLGAMTPLQVREYMEKAQIFLFTSDFNEGWGAVLNEAMNSGCSVIASHAIGSVPFLIKNGVNGMIYKNGNNEDLFNKTKWLLEHSNERIQMAQNAYLTIVNEWNAQNAAYRLLELTKKIMAGNQNPNIFVEGPCSIAPYYHNNWYKS